jgi:hypothetical protein
MTPSPSFYALMIGVSISTLGIFTIMRPMLLRALRVFLGFLLDIEMTWREYLEARKNAQF